MPSVASESQLRRLRPGDRLEYKNVKWDVIDYSTYSDPYGYQTEEWLLEYQSSKIYYLLREFDPENRDNRVHWYLGEKILQPRLFLPESPAKKVPHLWEDIQRGSSPYPSLKLFNKVYYFESQTQGSYQKKGEKEERITWDYWDQPHQNNLALEAWNDGTLSIYLSKVVHPEEFSQIKIGIPERKYSSFLSGDLNSSYSVRQLKIIAATILMMIGFFLIIFG